MVERRKSKRLTIFIPTNIKILGIVTYFPTSYVETNNVSHEGLLIVIKINLRAKDGELSIKEVKNSLRLVLDLLLYYKPLELGIRIFPEGRSLKVVGNVRWCEGILRREFCYIRAGVLIEEMEIDDRIKWIDFVRNIA